MANLVIDCETRTKKSYDETIINPKKLLKSVNKVTNEHMSLLKNKPWWNPIFENFQIFIESKFPGTHIVGIPSIDANFSIFKVDTFFVPNITTKLHIMEQSECHANCEALYQKNKTHKIYTGYALSKDGLWRNHSWIITKNGSIIETTELRVLYLGYKYDKSVGL